MTDNVNKQAECRAFISYSHADRAFAFWLHRKLERYRLPYRLRSAKTTGQIFIDRAELAAGADLSQEVRKALARSQALIVVASPTARASRWVKLEIELFRELHPDRPVLVALCSGEPHESFPTPLLQWGDRPVEPLAADFRRQGDGRRLAFLKLTAGLAEVPLDRLMQRDNQRRLRRVMTITVAALIVSVGMAMLTVAALRARVEAERQHNESEALVEFMLTDLRQKLEAVGRLDVMDAVNARAARHYQAMGDDATLPEGTLARRARLLTTMGQDAISEGHSKQAEVIFTQSWRITDNLLRRHPDDPDRIFDHAQNEYWLGDIASLASNQQQERSYFTQYAMLAARLAQAQPGAIRSRREIAYAESNLCALAPNFLSERQAALKHCAKATDSAQWVARKLPHDLQAQIDLSADLAWQADATAAHGEVEAALALRRQQNTLVDTLPARFPRDARALEAQMLARIGLAKSARAADHLAEARTAAREAAQMVGRLRVHDPTNHEWADWQRQIKQLMN